VANSLDAEGFRSRTGPSGCEAARRGVFSVDCSSEMSADRFLAVFEGV